MSQVATPPVVPSTTDDANRKRKERAELSGGEPPAKFSKTSEKVVPSVVMVDFGNNPSSQTAQQPQVAEQQPKVQPPPVKQQAKPEQPAQPQQAKPEQQAQPQQQQSQTASNPPPMRVVASRIPWKLLNNRALLKKVLQANRVNQYGAAYVSIDVPTLEAETGMQFNLAPYNHIKIEGPWMRNIFGFSTKTVGNNTSHSCNLDISDAMVDPDVLEFAQFLALFDEVVLELCLKLSLDSDYVQQQVDWMDDCKDEAEDEDGTTKVNVDKMRRKVARYFHGSLRCSNKVRSNRDEFKPITWNKDSQRFVVPNIYWFRTKIKGKKNNDKLMDVAVYADGDPPRRVFYMDEPSLLDARKSFVKPQLEMPALNFVQKEWFATWVTRKVLYRDAAKAAEEAEAADNLADFEGMAGQPVQTSDAELRAIAQREADFLKQQQNVDSVAAQMTVDDDGGF